MIRKQLTVYAFRGDDPRDGYRAWAHFKWKERHLVDLHTQLTSNWQGGGVLSLDVGGQEETIGLTVAWPGFFAHVSAELSIRWAFRPPVFGYGSREFGLHGKPWDLRVTVFAPDGASTSTPRYPRLAATLGRKRRRRMRPEPCGEHWATLAGWDLRFVPLDWALGRRTRLQQVDEDPYDAWVLMPEGRYPCKVTMSRRTDGRPRWPFGWKTTSSGDVKLGVPIPVPGKGENSWDCGDNATHSVYGPFGSPEEALAAVASSCMNTRRRYASERWVPDTGWPDLHGVARKQP